jgi:hypothetical protein
MVGIMDQSKHILVDDDMATFEMWLSTPFRNSIFTFAPRPAVPQCAISLIPGIRSIASSSMPLCRVGQVIHWRFI